MPEIHQGIAAGRVSKLFVPCYKETTDSTRPGEHTAAILQLPGDILTLEEISKGVIGQGGDIVAVEIGAYPEIDSLKALVRF